ncbi:DUF559 domain-containing protein [candidate division WOR-3 bacterium]|nr:DUF559 domain-containing protein [candidate division WOR-3 bacterium]
MKSNRNAKLLVAILKNPEDFNIAKNVHWYRIPVDKADKLLSKIWPPEWIAFYHPLNSGDKAFSVRFCARVKRIEKAKRWQLFPHEKFSTSSDKEYYQIRLGDLVKLPVPIVSKKLRRIVFIQTTLKKLFEAREINDLFHGTKIEEKLWSKLKEKGIPAERQEIVKTSKQRFILDFSIYCRKGKIDVETDGDFWHHNPSSAKHDNERNNSLSSKGWHILRFTSGQIETNNCNKPVEIIFDTIDFLGGLKKSS